MSWTSARTLSAATSNRGSSTIGAGRPYSFPSASCRHLSGRKTKKKTRLLSFAKDNRAFKLRMESSITHPDGDVNQTIKPEPQASDVRNWFRAMRNVEALELIRRNPNAFILAYVIGYRAQWSDKFNQFNLAPGESLIGDWREYGMSEQKYRTAKRQLEEWGFATFKATTRGTIARLTDERLFYISDACANEPINRQLTTKQRTANGRLTTTNTAEEGKTAIEREERPHASLAGWQLKKDIERTQKQITDIEQSTNPDQLLLSTLKSDLRALRTEMRFRAPPPKPRPLPAVQPQITSQPTGKGFVELSPDELKSYTEQMKQAVEGGVNND
jgi:hypothetical protein